MRSDPVTSNRIVIKAQYYSVVREMTKANKLYRTL